MRTTATAFLVFAQPAPGLHGVAKNTGRNRSFLLPVHDARSVRAA